MGSGAPVACRAPLDGSASASARAACRTFRQREGRRPDDAGRPRRRDFYREDDTPSAQTSSRATDRTTDTELILVRYIDELAKTPLVGDTSEQRPENSKRSAFDRIHVFRFANDPRARYYFRSWSQSSEAEGRYEIGVRTGRSLRGKPPWTSLPHRRPDRDGDGPQTPSRRASPQE